MLQGRYINLLELRIILKVQGYRPITDLEFPNKEEGVVREGNKSEEYFCIIHALNSRVLCSKGCLLIDKEILIGECHEYHSLHLYRALYESA